MRSLLSLLLLSASLALAQGYPSRALHLIVPFPPGGPTDIVGRLVAQKLSDALGQPVVVENRAGAGGTVGSAEAAKSRPDGYTLLYGSTSTLAIAPSVYSKLPYDPHSAFAPISLVSRGAIIAAVNAQLPASTLKEFVELAKARPGKLNYGSAGTGPPPPLAAELLQSVCGVGPLHVPYKGGAAAISGLARR